MAKRTREQAVKEKRVLKAEKKQAAIAARAELAAGNALPADTVDDETATGESATGDGETGDTESG